MNTIHALLALLDLVVGVFLLICALVISGAIGFIVLIYTHWPGSLVYIASFAILLGGGAYVTHLLDRLRREKETARRNRQRLR